MFPEKIHRYLYLFGLIALAFGMMMGAVPTSVPQIILITNWLLEGKFRLKWEQVRNNKIFWALSSVFLIHVLGLLWTDDLSAGVADGRIKIPLMLLPLVLFSSAPLSKKEFHVILGFFLAGTLVNTLWCLSYSFVLHHTEVVRNTSRFMSHIRLGLYLNVAVAVCSYFIFISKSVMQRVGLILLALYFIFILFVFGLASGLANFAILFVLAMIVFIYRQTPVFKIAGIVILLGFVGLVVNYLLTVKNAQLVVRDSLTNRVMKASPSGRAYVHYDTTGQKENGNYIFVNIQPEELLRGWNREFPQDSFSYNPQHNLQRYEILLRYLASKGLNKDSAGIASLTTSDKKNIQKGISNYEYPEWSFLHKRMYELVNEYDEFMNERFVNGHSLTMRLYFWQTATQVIKRNYLCGVGTGDVQAELNKTYVETKSALHPEWYKRPHNQFLTITVALGIFGLFIFMWSLIYPLMALKNYLSLVYWPFIIVAMLSFVMEDTLETQAGVTFYAFFNSLFLSVAWFRKREQGNSVVD